MNAKIFFRAPNTTGQHFPEAAILLEQEELLVFKQKDGTVVISSKSKQRVTWGLVDEFGTDILLPQEIAATIFSVHTLLERVEGQMDFLKTGRDALNSRTEV